MGRECETIDLLSAYLQIMLGGDIEYYIIIPADVIDILPQHLKDQFLGLGMPVCRLMRAIYGLQRAGSDFIHAFSQWLSWNQWASMEEEPAVMYLWHAESDSDALARAAKLRVWVDSETGAGRNPFEVARRDVGPGYWRDKVKQDQPHAPVLQRSSKHCSTMATYVDDCELDAQKRRRQTFGR